jgi:pilus assembly protein Flp/PilA
LTLIFAACYPATVFKNKEGQNVMIYMPREEGQGLIEYALILVLVAVVVIVILSLLGPAIGNIFSNIVNTL